MPANAQSSPTSTLTVDVNGAEHQREDRCAPISGLGGFPSEPSKAVRHKGSTSILDHSFAEVTFKDLPDGTHAVSVLHDENDNGKMDKNFIGIRRKVMKPPTIRGSGWGRRDSTKAKFSVTQPHQTIEIKLIY